MIITRKIESIFSTLLVLAGRVSTRDRLKYKYKGWSTNLQAGLVPGMRTEVQGNWELANSERTTWITHQGPREPRLASRGLLRDQIPPFWVMDSLWYHGCCYWLLSNYVFLMSIQKKPCLPWILAIRYHTTLGKMNSHAQLQGAVLSLRLKPPYQWLVKSGCGPQLWPERIKAGFMGFQPV